MKSNLWLLLWMFFWCLSSWIMKLLWSSALTWRATMREILHKMAYAYIFPISRARTRKWENNHHGGCFEVLHEDTPFLISMSEVWLLNLMEKYAFSEVTSISCPFYLWWNCNYPTNEHFSGMKTLTKRKKIAAAAISKGKAKRMGRQVLAA